MKRAWNGAAESSRSRSEEGRMKLMRQESRSLLSCVQLPALWLLQILCSPFGCSTTQGKSLRPEFRRRACFVLPGHPFYLPECVIFICFFLGTRPDGDERRIVCDESETFFIYCRLYLFRHCFCSWCHHWTVLFSSMNEKNSDNN